MFIPFATTSAPPKNIPPSLYAEDFGRKRFFQTHKMKRIPSRKELTCGAQSVLNNAPNRRHMCALPLFHQREYTYLSCGACAHPLSAANTT